MSHVSTTIQTCQFIGLHCICSFVIVLELQVESSSSVSCVFYFVHIWLVFLASQDALEVMSVTYSVTYWTLALT